MKKKYLFALFSYQQTDKIILVNRMAIIVASPVFFILLELKPNQIKSYRIAIGYSSLAFFHHSFVQVECAVKQINIVHFLGQINTK